MPRKRTYRSVQKSCDSLWSKCIRTRDPICVKCGKPTTEAHHIFGRANKSTRWDLRNGIGLCSYCHVFSKQGFEQAPYRTDNMDIIDKKLGVKHLNELEELTNQLQKITLEDLLDIEARLKEQLKLLAEEF